MLFLEFRLILIKYIGRPGIQNTYNLAYIMKCNKNNVTKEK